MTLHHIARLSRRALAVTIKLRLDLAYTRITDQSSAADVEREAESAVNDLLQLATSTYPTAPAELMSTIARSLLAEQLSRRRTEFHNAAHGGRA
jgi:hypothetical protein